MRTNDPSNISHADAGMLARKVFPLIAQELAVMEKKFSLPHLTPYQIQNIIKEIFLGQPQTPEPKKSYMELRDQGKKPALSNPQSAPTPAPRKRSLLPFET
jgi:hypothetical protein